MSARHGLLVALAAVLLTPAVARGATLAGTISNEKSSPIKDAELGPATNLSSPAESRITAESVPPAVA